MSRFSGGLYPLKPMTTSRAQLPISSRNLMAALAANTLANESVTIQSLYILPRRAGYRRDLPHSRSGPISVRNATDLDAEPDRSR